MRVERRNIRFWTAMKTLSLVALVLSGCSPKPEKLGLSYRAEFCAERVRLLVDEAWTNAEGHRQVSQEIFDEVFSIIAEAEQFVLLDFFLLNEFLYQPEPGMHNLSREITDRLVNKRKSNPEVKIVFITDPINTVYGSIESPHFEALEGAGVNVVWTDLDQLRDSNPVISKPWRLLIKPWGVGPGRALKNPMGEGRISIRSMLKLLNFKANHRKLVVTDKSLLITSANPHSGSSAHWNTALRVDGAGQDSALESESAILNFSGAEAVGPALRSLCNGLHENISPKTDHKLELLTEGRIKEKVLTLIDDAQSGSRIDLSMFYLSDRDVIDAFIDAGKRGCKIRVILDPAKDAFGRIKNGIPNRQSAARLVKAGIPLRWAETHGEQFHVKMLYVEHPGETATLLQGSCNFTRRNLENFNGECDLALTTTVEHETMLRARATFDRWWSNAEGRKYTTDYITYADRSLRRRVQAWWMEVSGMGTF